MLRRTLRSGLMAALLAAPALAGKDDFNRADLGPNWDVTAGSLFISGNALQGDTGSLGAFTLAASDRQASVDVLLNGTDLQYGAVAIGDVSSGNNIFVKIQGQNGTETFSHAAFYVGNNGGGLFFALESPVTEAHSARLTVALKTTWAAMAIDTNFDGSPEAVYTFDYGASFPSGVGLGTYGPVSLDNLKTRSAVSQLAARLKVRAADIETDAIDLSR